MKLTRVKVYSPGESLAMRNELQRFGKILCNTADILDEAIASGGRQAYHNDLRANWNEWISGKETNIPDLKLVWGHGVSGGNGLHDGWEKVTNGSVAVDQSLVYRLW